MYVCRGEGVKKRRKEKKRKDKTRKEENTHARWNAAWSAFFRVQLIPELSDTDDLSRILIPVAGQCVLLIG